MSRTFANDFQILVAHHPHGTDPSLNDKVAGNPPKLRTAIKSGPVYVTDGESYVGAVHASHTPQSGTITVVDNDFSKGRAVLILGQFEIVSHIHYTPGGSLAATATAIATSISGLPGWSATALGAVVTAEYENDTTTPVVFKVLHDDTAEGSIGSPVINLELSPTTGNLLRGSPAVGAPVIT